MKKTSISVLIVLVLIGLGVYLLLTTPASPGDNNNPYPVPAGPISVKGKIACLPKVGTGPQTMECAIGLQDDEGLYYSLRNLSDHDTVGQFVDTSIRVKISGELVHEETFGPDGNRYDTVGVIEITSIQNI